MGIRTTKSSLRCGVIENNASPNSSLLSPEQNLCESNSWVGSPLDMPTRGLAHNLVPLVVPAITALDTRAERVELLVSHVAELALVIRNKAGSDGAGAAAEVGSQVGGSL